MEKTTNRIALENAITWKMSGKLSGTCLNARGDGKTTSGHYISYAKVKGHAKGKRYTTWLVYGNDNSIDNVAMRFDR